MTPAQLRARLRQLKLSQMSLAQRLKVDGRTVRRWVAGDRRIPEAVALLLDAWAKRP